MTITSSPRQATTTARSRDQRTLNATVNTFAAGMTRIEAIPYAIVCMHIGPSVEVVCDRGGKLRHGREVAGDLDIIPAHTPAAWETKQSGATLIMRVPDELLRSVAIELDMDPGNIEIADRFQLRDPFIEHIGWAIKADIDSGGAGGQLFRESLGTALAARLLQRHNRRSLPMRDPQGGLSAWKLKLVISHIEDNLESELSLAEIAKVAGVSVSHLKTLFRRSTGTPVHQYILRRRVERAKLLNSINPPALCRAPRQPVLQQTTTLPASPSVIRSSRRSANVRGLCGLHRHERPGHSS